MKNFYKLLIQFIIINSIILLIDACVKTPPIIPPEAEITNIYNITDSTANVDVQVTKQSNSDGDQSFGFFVDSVSNTGNKTQVQIIELTPFPNLGALNSSYTTKISKLHSKTIYYIYLNFSGEFNIGGPDESKNFNIGTPKTFTTN